MAYLQGVSTSSTVWRNGTAYTVQKDGYEAVLRALVTLVAGKATLSAVTYTGTGNGTIDNLDGGVAAPTESWDVDFTSATAFTVTGTVSGLQTATGTVGTPYTSDSDEIHFLITAGGTAFIATDKFEFDATLTTTPAADRWAIDRWEPSGDLSDVDDALIWHGLGDSTQAIYAGIRLNPGSGLEGNWALRGYTGYSASADFDNQPGVNTTSLDMSSWTGDCDFWITTNSRRYICVTNASGRYFSCYQGLILPFGSPNEFPYPLFISGTRHTFTAYNENLAKDYWAGFSQPLWQSLGYHAAEFRDLNGDWVKYQNTALADTVSGWPNGSSIGNPRTMWLNNQNYPGSGDHQLLPIMLWHPPATSGVPLTAVNWGVLDGAMVVTGFGNSPETVLNIGGTNWVCFGETWNLGVADFYAVEMA